MKTTWEEDPTELLGLEEDEGSNELSGSEFDEDEEDPSEMMGLGEEEGYEDEDEGYDEEEDLARGFTVSDNGVVVIAKAESIEPVISRPSVTSTPDAFCLPNRTPPVIDQSRSR